MRRARVWICRVVSIMIAVNMAYVTFLSFTTKVPSRGLTPRESMTQALIPSSSWDALSTMTTGSVTGMPTEGMFSKDPRESLNNSDGHHSYVIYDTESRTVAGYPPILRNIIPSHTDILQGNIRGDTRSLNPYLNYTITHGMDDKGDYFLFRPNPHHMKPIDFNLIADPPWGILGTRTVTDVDCKPLIQGDTAILNSTISYSRPKSFFLTDEQYLKGTRNCDTFIRQRGYMTSPVNKEEEGFPIAFSIVMYKDMELTERLLRAIYRPQNYYCIHVERFTSVRFYEAVKSVTDCFSNVFLTEHRYHVARNLMSMLQPEFECMRMLAKIPGWRYFINLTGQEFPIRTNLELVRILKAYNGANDVQADYSQRFRYRTMHAWIHNRAVSSKEPPPLNLTVLKAQVHVAVARGFVDYILYDRRADQLLWWLRDSKVPDEIYFGMLNHNPQLAVPGALNGTRHEASHKRCFTRFKRFHLKRPCYGNRVSHYICILGLRMLSGATRSPAMFANKFHLHYQPVALDCLEEWHHLKVLSELQGQDAALDYGMYSKQVFVTKHF